MTCLAKSCKIAINNNGVVGNRKDKFILWLQQISILLKYLFFFFVYYRLICFPSVVGRLHNKAFKRVQMCVRPCVCALDRSTIVEFSQGLLRDYSLLSFFLLKYLNNSASYVGYSTIFPSVLFFTILLCLC